MEIVGPHQTPPTDAERIIGREMRRLRERLGITQQDIAARMIKDGFRFHQTQIAKMERGERPIRVNEWLSIAAALGTTPQEMLASALAANAEDSHQDQLTLADLQEQKGEVEERMLRLREEVQQARNATLAARMAMEMAQVEARDAEMREREIQVRYEDARYVLATLEDRINRITANETRANRNMQLDSVLDEAEPSIAALGELVKGEASIGQILAAARERAGMTVDALSAAAGISPGVVRSLERPAYTDIASHYRGARPTEEILSQYERMKVAITRFAEAVGVDPAPLLEQYEAQIKEWWG
ncbi:helix-turn-helix domain-containing protein [Streptomyces caniscabiei]|uniref:Helix-turn-helix domain-containing protein n=1 Tax=Streptomyces caniscabiei TaxID=2746961 RepID=A0ABU4N142_9ACTN|nr:helix-turn-helix domain-containing protein [Streptomyces caniscabiei]MDX2948174.1 helix-turn-helix domain-containing protein [Streptomyces caniscabiei]MDX3042794.1 helix-turn-helix domain-containing protein [Streptomyces caniscabiei]